MRKLIFLLTLLLAAPVLSATTITVSDGTDTATLTTGTKVEAAVTWKRTTRNAQECTRLGLPTNCTRSQATALDSNADVWNTNIDFMTKATGPSSSLLNLLKVVWLAEAQADALATVGPLLRDLTNPTNAQCAGVGLANGCTAAQVQDAVCVAVGKHAGCIR